jgi:hypothetical protein
MVSAYLLSRGRRTTIRCSSCATFGGATLGGGTAIQGVWVPTVACPCVYRVCVISRLQPAKDSAVGAALCDAAGGAKPLMLRALAASDRGEDALACTLIEVRDHL